MQPAWQHLVDDHLSIYDDVGITIVLPSSLTAIRQLSMLRIHQTMVLLYWPIPMLQQLEITQCFVELPVNCFGPN